jgi:hypothetical protein
MYIEFTISSKKKIIPLSAENVNKFVLIPICMIINCEEFGAGRPLCAYMGPIVVV